MAVYSILVGMVSLAVNFLLLLGTNRLLGSASNLCSIGIGATVGAAHSMLCILSGFLEVHLMLSSNQCIKALGN